MADTLGQQKSEENEFETFDPEFATELSNKLEHMSPRNSNMDLYEERLHEMTASYSEISFDSQNSGSPGSSELDFAGKKGAVGPSERPDKLELNPGLQDLHLEGTVTKEGDMVLFVTEDLENKIKLSSPVTKKGDTPPFPGSRISTPCLYRQALMPQLPIIDPNVLNDLEMEVRRVATSVDTLTENLAGILRSVSALTVECLEVYRDAVCKTCDAVDSNIKSMYQLMAKCEELSKSMKPIYKLSEQIKGIKRATLTKQASTAEWVIDQDRAEIRQYLTLKQVLLGEDTKDGEQQVVTVETGDIAALPLARLKKGSVEMWGINIKCNVSPVKLTLAKGSGPVHVLGTHTLDVERSMMVIETDSECLDEEEIGLEEEEEEVETKVEAAAKKRKLDELDQVKTEGGKKKKVAAKGKKVKSPGKSPPAKRKK